MTEKLLLTQRDIARKYGLSEPTVSKWVRTGVLDSVRIRIGDRYYFPVSALDRWITDFKER